uniref:Uncharacterized protein n=1 Tax=Kalanchoe fedtschenkoi TaxID=63787 RepID=A0A7N1A2S9_KALFE
MSSICRLEISTNIASNPANFSPDWKQCFRYRSQVLKNFSVSARGTAAMSSSKELPKKKSTLFLTRSTDESKSAAFFDDGIGGNGGDRSDGGGKNGGGGSDDDSKDENGSEKEFGPILKFEEVMRLTEARNATLPADMLEAAKTTGIRKLILERFLDLQSSAWPLGFGMKHCSVLRDRMLADPSFLFKVGTEKYKKGERIFGQSLSCTWRIFWLV